MNVTYSSEKSTKKKEMRGSKLMLSVAVKSDSVTLLPNFQLHLNTIFSKLSFASVYI